MKIRCPECGAGYRVDPSKARPGSSLRIKCVKCTNQFVVKSPQPRAEPPVAPFSSTTTEQPLPARGFRKKKILVVDDSLFFREMILDILRPLGVSLLAAATADDALEIVSEAEPQIVLHDLNMPGKNGYDLIRAIRQRHPPSAIRLLAMSAVFRKELDIAEVLRVGADDFISKSFRPEQLRAHLSKFLENE